VAHAARMLHEDIPFIRTSIDPRRGILRIAVDSDGEVDQRELPADLRVTEENGGAASEVIFEKLPPEVWAQVSPSVVADGLSRGIRSAYDPHNVLNPGILGD